MKKTFNVFLSFIIFSSCFLCTNVLCTTTQYGPNKDEPVSSNALAKDKVARFSDVPAPVRKKISKHQFQAKALQFTPGKKPFPQGDVKDCFGVSVSIYEDTAVIGSCGDDHSVSDSGAAYVFYRNQNGTDNWGLVKKITAGNRESNNRFGISVSVYEDTLVVGAYGDDDERPDSGAAYVFYRNQGGTDNWGLAKKITAGNREPNNRFGISVYVYEYTLAVGAYGEDDNRPDSGAACVFYRNSNGNNQWGPVKRLRQH